MKKMSMFVLLILLSISAQFFQACDQKEQLDYYDDTFDIDNNLSVFTQHQICNQYLGHPSINATSIITGLVNDDKQAHNYVQCKKQDACIYYSPQIKTREFVRSTPEFMQKVEQARAIALDKAAEQAKSKGKELTNEEIRDIKVAVRKKLYRASSRGKKSHKKNADSPAGKVVTQQAVQKYKKTAKGQAAQKRANDKRY